MTNLERRTVCFFENDMIFSITFIMQKAFQIKPDIEVLKQLLQRNPTSYVVTYMMVNAKHCLFLAQVILFSALIADCLLNVNLVQERWRDLSKDTSRRGPSFAGMIFFLDFFFFTFVEGMFDQACLLG